MKKSDKASNVKRNTLSRLGNRTSSPLGARRLAFEAMERRLLLSATDLEMPALHQEAEPDSLVPPMVMERVADTLEWPTALPMDMEREGPSVDESSQLAMDFMVAGNPPPRWDPNVMGDRPLGEGEIPVPSRPMDLSPPREGGYVDVGMIADHEGLGRDSSHVVEPGAEETFGFAKDLLEEAATILPRRDLPVEIAIGTGGSYEGLPLQGSMTNDAWTEYGPVRDLTHDWDSAEFSFSARPEWALVDWHDPSLPPLEYSVIIRHAGESWDPDMAGVLFGLTGMDAWFLGMRLDGEAVLGRAMAEMRPPAHDHGAPFDPETSPKMEVDAADARRSDGWEGMMVREGDAFPVRVLDDGYEADTFGSKAVLGSELTAEAAVAIPILVAESSALPSRFGATESLAMNDAAAAESGQFIDVGLVMMNAVPRTAGVAGAASETGLSEEALEETSLPGDIAASAPLAEADGELVAQGTLSGVLLSMTPESGELVESDLTALEGRIVLNHRTRGEAHDAVFEEMAESPRTQTAGLTHFWAPAIFAVSALGRQAWKKKKRRDASGGPVSGSHRHAATPTIAFRMDEETDR